MRKASKTSTSAPAQADMQGRVIQAFNGVDAENTAAILLDLAIEMRLVLTFKNQNSIPKIRPAFVKKRDLVRGLLGVNTDLVRAQQMLAAVCRHFDLLPAPYQPRQAIPAGGGTWPVYSTTK